MKKNGWELSEKFVDKVVKAGRPKTLTELRSFLGLVNWQRSFIPKFSEITGALYELQKSKLSPITNEVWTKEC